MNIRPLCPGPLVEPLSPTDLERVHSATLDLLGRVGVVVRSDSILERLRTGGVSVDGDRVRFRPEMVQSAIASAPAAYSLAARNPELDLALDGERGYLSTDGCAAEIIDLESGERRPTTTGDLAALTRVADALEEVSFLWQSVTARDVPPPVAPLHEVRAQFANTSKHIQVLTAVTPGAAAGVVELARVIAGGERELRSRPVVSSFQCSISPLVFDGEPLEAGLVFAEAGVPSGIVVMAIQGATAPATTLGTLIQTNAEVLAGITILQTLVPGSATFYGACSTVMDLRSGAATCGGPEDLWLQLACAQLARHYSIPSNIGVFASGSKSPGWQAGVENALSGMCNAFGGADMMSGAGLLYGARVFSYEELLLDAEIYSIICRLREGYSGAGAAAPGDISTAVNTIEAVGPGGHFLAESHTLEHMREFWMTRAFNRDTWEEWQAAGRPEPHLAARQRAVELLRFHEPEPLDEDLAAELDGIVGAFDSQILREAG